VKRSDRRLEFFVELATEQAEEIEPKLPRKQIFDNRLEFDALPPTTRSRYQYYGQEEVLEWLEQYVQRKFGYLLFLVEDPTSARHNMSRVLEKEGDVQTGWVKVLEAWEGLAERERLAYLYRIDQLPLEVVNLQWYNELPEFKRWSDTCRETISRLRNGFLDSDFAENYMRLLNTIADGAPLGFDRENLLSWIELGVLKGFARMRDNACSAMAHDQADQESAQALGGLFAPSIEGDPALVCLTSVHRLLKEVPAEYLKMIVAGRDDPYEYVGVFLRLLRMEYNCGLCDYLEVTNDGQEIKFGTTTVDVDDAALRRDLEDYEAYLYGEGITGSILLGDPNDQWFHVGSNDVERDPRQSPEHKNRYERCYGPIYNFWTFPVVEDNRIVAAFRVVNALDGGSKVRAEGWPYLSRLELCVIARWFSALWSLLQSFKLSESNWSIAVGKRYERTSQLIEKLNLRDWVSPAFLSVILDHLPTVILRRVEKRRMGCCLLIVAEQDVEDLVSSLQPYGGVESHEIHGLSELARHYEKVSPIGGCFVLTGDGALKGVCELRVGAGLYGTSAIEDLTRTYLAVAFLVERDGNSARVWRGGHLAAEYYLHERSGTWEVRYYQEALEQILNALDGQAPSIPERVVREVFTQALELSYVGHGALLVIGEDLERYCEYGSGFKVDKALSSLEGPSFLELARQDGATIIDTRGNVLRSSTFLRPRHPFTLSSQLRELLKREDKGARHRAGCEVATAHPDALVIVVSENRSICVMHRESRILWDF